MAKKVIYSVRIELKGITPMLQNKCGVIEKESSSVNTDYSERWKQTTYINMVTNNICIPSMILMSMLASAAKGHKIGRVFISKLIIPGLDISPFEIDIKVNNKYFKLVDVEKNNWLYTCSGKRGSGMVAITRTAIPIGWTAEFNIDVSDSLIKKEILREILEEAGYKAGIGDQRPNSPKKPGKFGQFDLIKFE